MGKYIFFTGLYLPKPGATGMCIHQLAKEAVRRGHDVTTICYADEDHGTLYDGVTIKKIRIPGFLKENAVSNSFGKKMNQVRSIGSKFVHLRSYPLRSTSLVRRYCAEVDKLIDDQDEPVTIVASVNPLEAVIAADKVKRKFKDRVKTVYYCADTLSNEKGDSGILSAEYRTRCGLRWEKKLFSSFDLIMIMECHKEHYLSDEFAGYTPKMHVVNFPLFTKLPLKEFRRDETEIVFVYAGTLYRELRNPEFMCKTLSDLAKVKKIKVYILGGGDCDDILDRYIELTHNSIERLGMQTHNKVLHYLGKADVLLSIGNTESPMAPSKIYEYMSTGRPIVHFYTHEDDPCILPLGKYGNAILLKSGETSAVEKIIGVIANRFILQYEDVREAFLSSTPEYTLDEIEKG